MPETPPQPDAQQDDYARVQAHEGARSPHDALQWAHDQVGIPGWSGMCLSFVRTGYNIPAVYDSAQTAWEQADHRHETNDWHDIPEGAPVFMYGSNPDGHVAFNDGGGYMVTTNSGTGYPVRQSYDLWASWGYRPQGWTEDLNGYYVCSPNGDNPDTPDGEVTNVPYGSRSTKDVHSIEPNAVWTPVYVDEGNATSILISPGDYAVTLNLYLENVPAGKIVKTRFIEVDTEDDGSGAKQVAEHPIVEHVATGGQSAIQVAQFGKLGKPTTDGKPSRRLRAQVLIESPTWGRVVYAGARWFH